MLDRSYRLAAGFAAAGSILLTSEQHYRDIAISVHDTEMGVIGAVNWQLAQSIGAAEVDGLNVVPRTAPMLSTPNARGAEKGRDTSCVERHLALVLS